MTAKLITRRQAQSPTLPEGLYEIFGERKVEAEFFDICQYENLRNVTVRRLLSVRPKDSRIPQGLDVTVRGDGMLLIEGWEAIRGTETPRPVMVPHKILDEKELALARILCPDLPFTFEVGDTVNCIEGTWPKI